MSHYSKTSERQWELISDLVVSKHLGQLVQVRRSDISDLGVSCCSVASAGQQCYRSSGSGHNETATQIDADTKQIKHL